MQSPEFNLLQGEGRGGIARRTFSIIKGIEVGSLSSVTVEGLVGIPYKVCGMFVF